MFLKHSRCFTKPSLIFIVSEIEWTNSIQTGVYVSLSGYEDIPNPMERYKHFCVQATNDKLRTGHSTLEQITYITTLGDPKTIL